MRVSICTGVRTAGFQDRQGGAFVEVMQVRNDRELAAFCTEYGVTPHEIVTIYEGASALSIFLSCAIIVCVSMEGNKNIRIAFAGGGTGGHICPGIAVADELKRLAADRGLVLDVCWIGNSSGMDRDIVSKNLVNAGGSISAFYGIPSGKLRRYFSLQNFLDLFKIAAGFFKSLFLLATLKPDCLFS